MSRSLGTPIRVGHSCWALSCLPGHLPGAVVEVTGFQGMLEVMISLHCLLEGWKLIPRVGRPFQFCSSKSQRSLTLGQPELTKALPSLLSMRPSGLLSWLVMRGFPKIGCLNSSTLLVGFDLLKLGLTVIQALIMFFQIEHGSLLSFGATNSQLMS